MTLSTHHLNKQKMKKITSFISTNIQTMTNRMIPSPSPLGINNQKPMKRTVLRKNKKHKHTTKHLVFNKLVSYLISDSYMYTPLVSHQPPFDFPPPSQIVTSPGVQEEVALPIKGSDRKLIDKVIRYLEADCYMYSPLVRDESRGGQSARKGGGRGVSGTKHLRARRVVKSVGCRE